MSGVEVGLGDLLLVFRGESNDPRLRPIVSFEWERTLTNQILLRRYPRDAYEFELGTIQNSPLQSVRSFTYNTGSMTLRILTPNYWLVASKVDDATVHQVERLNWYRHSPLSSRLLSLFFLDVGTFNTANGRLKVAMQPIDKHVPKGSATSPSNISLAGFAKGVFDQQVRRSVGLQLALLHLAAAEAGLALSATFVYLQPIESPFVIETSRYKVAVVGLLVRAELSNAPLPVPTSAAYALRCGDVPFLAPDDPEETTGDPSAFRAACVEAGIQLHPGDTPSSILDAEQGAGISDGAPAVANCLTPTEAALDFLARHPDRLRTEWQQTP